MAEYDFPDDLQYTAEDEWVRRDGETVTIGVTDFAQNQLGDIVFVELPDVGSEIEAGAPFGTIESVKAVSDLFAPLSGVVESVNEALEDEAEKVNESCYGDGWLVTLRATAPAQFEGLLDAQAYRQSVKERED